MARPIPSSIPASSMPTPRRWKRRLKTRSPSRPPPHRKRRGELALRRADLSPGRALRVHIQRVDRLARGHEQAVALHAAEAEVGAAFGQGDAADHHTVGCEHHNTVEFGIAHAPAAPEIAVDIDAKTVR